MVVVPKSTFRSLASANPGFSEADILNAGNPSSDLPHESDSTVIGAGIHGLIYAIHARMRYSEQNLRITVLEKAPKPQWKIGESTLPHFAQWTKAVGLHPEYLLRIFSLHNGLEFHVLDRDDPEKYKEFCNNGPPPFLLPGYQLQRAVSELLLTVFAQRKGVNVFHGHQADVYQTTLSLKGDVIPVQKVSDKAAKPVVTNSSLLVDATGRFRRYSSQFERVKRFEGFNTDAYFAYFETNDEASIAKHLNHFEGGHTNHICFPEGWMYLIRILSWEGSPIQNMMDMLHYMLDHADARTPGDEMPSTYELAKMFDCKVKWIWSIGVAVRNDTVYPANIDSYGSTAAERRFNYFVQKYPKMTSVMSLFKLLPDYHGPGTTWYLRKQLTYQTEVVSGPGWVTIGDGIGFTNPLLSPGINVGIATDTLAADLTPAAIMCKTEGERSALWQNYDKYCANALPSLNMMNKFLYLTFMDPILAPRVALMWQIVIGHALPCYSLARTGFGISLEKYAEYASGWVWGSQVEEYVKVASKTISLLEPIPLDQRVSKEVIEEIINYSDSLKVAALAAGKYQGFPFRYDGEFRNYDSQLNYDDEKFVTQDTFANQCRECETWHTLRGDWHKCYTCGVTRPHEDREISWRPALNEMELGLINEIAPSPQSVGKCLVDFVRRSKMGLD